MFGWDTLLRRNSPTPSELSTSSISTTSSASSTASMPIIYDSKTSKVELADSWDAVETIPNLVCAEATGKSLLAELKLNIGTVKNPIMDHLAWVDLSKLRGDAKNERKSGRINSILVRV